MSGARSDRRETTAKGAPLAKKSGAPMPTKGTRAWAALAHVGLGIADEERGGRRDGAGAQDSLHVHMLGRLAGRPMNRRQKGRETEAPELPRGLVLRHPGHHDDRAPRRLGGNEGMDAGEEDDGGVDGVDMFEKARDNAPAVGLLQRLPHQVLVDMVEDHLPAAAGMALEAVGDGGAILRVGGKGVRHRRHLGSHAVGDHAVIVENQHPDVHRPRSVRAV